MMGHMARDELAVSAWAHVLLKFPTYSPEAPLCLTVVV